MKKSKFIFTIILISCSVITACNNGAPKYNAYHVGKTFKIGNLEVMTKDLGEMDWSVAKNACKSLGNGWHLPTKEELNILYENKDSIGGFVSAPYWSSSDYGIISYHGGGSQNFLNGKWKYTNQFEKCYVRAVRAF